MKQLVLIVAMVLLDLFFIYKAYIWIHPESFWGFIGFVLVVIPVATMAARFVSLGFVLLLVYIGLLNPND
jgi:hypothetical protein